jgi:hypothetical protein
MNEEQFILKIVLDDGQFLVQLPNAEKKVKDLGKAFEFVKKNSKELTQAQAEQVQKNKDLISSSGLAGATLTEFGRFVSDLPFGITAVTNNLAQLSTLMATLVAKTGGTTEAFKLLGEQLKKGPLGIILVFQVVISLIQAFNKEITNLFKGTNKASEALKDLRSNFFSLAESIRENNKELKGQDKDLSKIVKLTQTLDDLQKNSENLSGRQRANLGRLRIAFKQQIEILEEYGVKVDETRIEEEGYLQSLIDRIPTITKIAEQLNQERIGIERDRILGTETETDLLQRELDLFIKTEQAKGNKEEEYFKSEEYQLLVAKIAKAKSDAKRKAAELQAEIDAALEVEDLAMTFGEAFEGYFDAFKEPLVVEEDLYDEGINALLEFNRFRQNFVEKSEEEVLKIMEKAAIDQLRILAKQSEGLVDFEKERLKIVEFFAEKIRQIRLEELQNNLQDAQQLLSEIQGTLNMLTDAELSREEAKTVALNNQLKERLRNENLSKEERIRINKEIEENELKLQKRRDEIAKRNFRLQKAFAIAQAAINTALAITDVLRREEGGLIKKGIAAIAIGVLGAAQIAAIASTKFVPTATSLPSGQAGVGGGAGGGRSGATDPAFNIVGTGQQFQLAQVIAQRTGEPIRAFVVSGDVRTGLALDRNIINSSKIN